MYARAYTGTNVKYKSRDGMLSNTYFKFKGTNL